MQSSGTSHHTACIQVRLPVDSSSACARDAFAGESFKKNFGHHSFVLMLQEVTVEYRDAADDRIREIHYEIE
jgi:hypothetical protein